MPRLLMFVLALVLAGVVEFGLRTNGLNATQLMYRDVVDMILEALAGVPRPTEE